MAIFSWGGRRQFSMIAILAVFMFLAVGSAIYYFYPEQTCFDKTQNQDEEDVDCGGICTPSKEHVRDFAVFWTRFFKIREEGAYDIVAFVENRNQFYAAKNIRYAIKLYDKENILRSVKEGRSCANAGERFVIFEPNFGVRNRIPARAILDIREVDWITKESKPLPVDILKKDLFLSETPPRVEILVKNKVAEIFKNVEATAILYDVSGDAVGASRTVLNTLDIQEEARLNFTWPQPIPQAVSIEIYLRSGQ